VELLHRPGKQREEFQRAIQTRGPSVKTVIARGRLCAHPQAAFLARDREDSVAYRRITALPASPTCHRTTAAGQKGGRWNSQQPPAAGYELKAESWKLEAGS
jgi:hypothetical protein